MQNIEKKFNNSNVANKSTLFCAMCIFLVSIMFLFLDSISNSVATLWFLAGLLWIFRYLWQKKNPYVEIKNGEIAINKSPIWKRKIKIQDIEKIIKSNNYGMELKIKNAKNVKISWFQVERGQRDELKKIIKEITPSKENENSNN